jgi:signal transduction histidine kinase
MEAVGRLAGGVAHDFNNLLTAIMGYNGLLLRDLGATDPRRKSAEQIRLAVQRAADLTRQLLVFSRRQHLDLRVIDLNRVVADMSPILGRLVGEAVQLEVEAAPGLGSVRADHTQIEQVLLNLAINARDAMPDGGRLRIATADVILDRTFEEEHPGSHAGPHVMLSVSDDGVGMDAGVQAHIFEPFFTTKSQKGGTGLGLSTVYGVVKLSGGYIAVESAPGCGATFRIYLPRCEEGGRR